MYAIIETGGKQYKVEKDSILDVEKLDKKKAEAITFTNVLLAADGDKVKVGQPHLKDVKVTAEVLRNFDGKKVTAFKFRRRKSSKSTKGHRQQLTKVRIKEIQSV